MRRRILLKNAILSFISISWMDKITFAKDFNRLKPSKNDGLGPFYPPNPSGLPFYPGKKILYSVNHDLTRKGQGSGRAIGEYTRVIGQVLNVTGEPVRGAQVEMWNTNCKGAYVSELDPIFEDINFAGYGKLTTDDLGRFEFWTVLPLSYIRYGFLIYRPPHFHFKVSSPGFVDLAIESEIVNRPISETPQGNSAYLTKSREPEFVWDAQVIFVMGEDK